MFAGLPAEVRRRVEARWGPPECDPHVTADGFALSQPLADRPVRVRMPNGAIWEPKNFTGRYEGEVTVRDALVRSKNVATVRLADSVGHKPLQQLVERSHHERRQHRQNDERQVTCWTPHTVEQERDGAVLDEVDALDGVDLRPGRSGRPRVGAAEQQCCPAQRQQCPEKLGRTGGHGQRQDRKRDHGGIGPALPDAQDAGLKADHVLEKEGSQ